MEEFDKENPKNKFPWQGSLVCHYCKVHYTLVKDGKKELDQHIKNYQSRLSRNRNASLDALLKSRETMLESF